MSVDAIDDGGQPLACPKCGEPLGFNLVSKVKDQHRYAFALKPGDGLFNTKTVGEVITQIGQLGNAIAKDIGVKAQTLVEKIETAEDRKSVV